jgi:hypothetical protein
MSKSGKPQFEGTPAIIAEAHGKLSDLETQIGNLLVDFQQETGLMIEEIAPRYRERTVIGARVWVKLPWDHGR